MTDPFSATPAGHVVEGVVGIFGLDGLIGEEHGENFVILPETDGILFYLDARGTFQPVVEHRCALVADRVLDFQGVALEPRCGCAFRATG